MGSLFAAAAAAGHHLAADGLGQGRADHGSQAVFGRIGEANACWHGAGTRRHSRRALGVAGTSNRATNC